MGLGLTGVGVAMDAWQHHEIGRAIGELRAQRDEATHHFERVRDKNRLLTASIETLVSENQRLVEKFNKLAEQYNAKTDRVQYLERWISEHDCYPKKPKNKG